MKYFLHEANALQDEKLTLLFIAHGYEGLGLFYAILERLTAQEKPIKTVALKAQLKVGKRLDKCWQYMEEIGLISASNGETFNERLANYVESYQKNRKKDVERKSKAIDNESDAEIFRSDSGNIPAAKGKIKKSKENKREGEANEDMPSPCFASLVKKQEDFYQTLSPYSQQYGLPMLRDFYNYWAEPNTRQTALRYENETTWDTKLRLERWSSKDDKWNRAHSGQPQEKDDPRTRQPNVYDLLRKEQEELDEVFEPMGD